MVSDVTVETGESRSDETSFLRNTHTEKNDSLWFATSMDLIVVTYPGLCRRQLSPHSPHVVWLTRERKGKSFHGRSRSTLSPAFKPR